MFKPPPQPGQASPEEIAREAPGFTQELRRERDDAQMHALAYAAQLSAAQATITDLQKKLARQR